MSSAGKARWRAVMVMCSTVERAGYRIGFVLYIDVMLWYSYVFHRQTWQRPVLAERFNALFINVMAMLSRLPLWNVLMTYRYSEAKWCNGSSRRCMFMVMVTHGILLSRTDTVLLCLAMYRFRYTRWSLVQAVLCLAEFRRGSPQTK